MTNQEIISFRDRIFATTDVYGLENIAAEVLLRYGADHAARQAREGASFPFLARTAAALSRTSHGLLLCCAAQYELCGGYGEYMADQYGDVSPKDPDALAEPIQPLPGSSLAGPTE